jgi:hypothetical protein
MLHPLAAQHSVDGDGKVEGFRYRFATWRIGAALKHEMTWLRRLDRKRDRNAVAVVKTHSVVVAQIVHPSATT